jgi:hypothetical protein
MQSALHQPVHLVNYSLCSIAITREATKHAPHDIDRMSCFAASDLGLIEQLNGNGELGGGYSTRIYDLSATYVTLFVEYS